MTYFTPDLYVRGQSLDDDVLDEVDRLWEEAGERYAAYLDTVRAEFSAGLCHIEERYYLHDAEIRGMARRGASFIITLQLDTPPHSLVTLTFDLDVDAVQNWEQGRYQPDRATLAYLRVIERQPTEAARAQEERVV